MALRGLSTFPSGYVLMAFFMFAPMAVVWAGLLHLPPPREHKREERTPVSGWALLKDRELRRAYIAAASNNAIWSIWGFMLPLYGHSIQLSATAIGTLAACLAAGGVQALVASGVGPEPGRVALLVVTLLAAGVGCGVFLVLALALRIPELPSIVGVMADLLRRRRA